jgi:hypothetical protein
LFLEVDTVTVNLADLYRAASAPVAYIDESFRIDNQQSYYILACALVASEFVAETREALLTFYSGEVMHATAMNHRRELESLRRGIRLVAGKHDGMDVVVTAPIAPDDEHGAAARATCIAFIAPLVQREDGTRLFVFDRPGRAGAERQDHFTFNDLRRVGALTRDTVVASAGWALTTERVVKNPNGLDLVGLLDTIEAEMKDAPERLQWAMNHCLAEIGIRNPSLRARAIDIGERLEVLKDYPTPPNCTSPFAPIWINEMVARQGG